jgi:ATP-dependent Clp protease ATP-binding subunit ClpA
MGNEDSQREPFKQGRLEEFEFDDTAFHVIEVAKVLVQNRGLITPDVLIRSLNDTGDGFRRIGLKVNDVDSTFSVPKQSETMRDVMTPALFSHGTWDIMYMAMNVSSDGVITRDNLITGLLYESYLPFDKFLIRQGVRKEKAIQIYSGERYVPTDYPENDTLDKYCVLLNRESTQDVYYREEELLRLEEVLLKKKKKNALLVGEAGVGKTAIVEGLAHRIHQGDLPMFRHHLIYSLDLAAVFAGTKERGSMETRWHEILGELQASVRPCILFIDEIHALLKSSHKDSPQSSNSGISIVDLMKPAMARTGVSIIASTTQDEYQRHFHHDKAFERRFSMIPCVEPTVEQTVNIISSMKGVLEKHYGCVIPDEIVSTCVRWSNDYIPNKHLPDKAITILDDLGSHLVMHNGLFKGTFDSHEALVEYMYYNEPERVFNLKKLRDLFDRDYRRIPVNRAELIEGLQQTLQKRVIGQEHAIDELVKCLQRSLYSLNEDSRPMGSFFFAGPTGVGKTLLASELARAIGASLHKIDMSEYMESHEVSKLIGSPPGYIGYEESGKLYTMLHGNSYNVLLLDEFEKAHERVQDLFLQILQDGVITNMHGKKVNFRDTIVIFTSNIPIHAKKSMGFVTTEPIQVIDYTWLKQRFRPEFLNRIDGVVPFKSIQDTDVRKIVRLEIQHVKTRFRARYQKELHVTNELIDHIVGLASVEEYGARNIRRLVETYVNQPTTEKILQGCESDIYLSM